MACPARQHAVGTSQKGILFMQQCRGGRQARGKQRGKGRIAAKTDHHARAATGDQNQCRHRGRAQCRHGPQAAQNIPLKGGFRRQNHPAGSRDQLCAAAIGQHQCVKSVVAQCFGNGQGREDVPASAASCQCDQGFCHHTASCVCGAALPAGIWRRCPGSA